MSAQAGSAITLNYREQPASAQAGGAIEFDEIAPRRTLRSGVAAPWVRAQAQRTLTRCLRPEAIEADVPLAAPWVPGRRMAARAVMPWVLADTADRRAGAPWGRYTRRNITPSTQPWGVASPADRSAALRWGRYAGRPVVGALMPWGVAARGDRAAALPWGVCAALDQRLQAMHPQARPSAARYELPWVRYSRTLNPGWGVVTPPSEPPTNEDGTIVVPTLRSYIVINTTTLVRLADSRAIPALSLQLRIDADSWGWGWSATVPASSLADLQASAPGEPVILEAQVNGVLWQLRVERIARERRHPLDRLAVSGRGIAAELADPAAPALSRDNLAGALTAQQIADAALEINGVPIGWTLNWQMADWLVPAGAWVHTGTAIEAVVRIAQAGGGYVQADPYLKTLHVLPRYPVLPWHFGDATPDFILPSAATTRESTEYIEKPAYNAVYVQGGALGGVLAQVKREGSAGDLVAEMVVDPLITHDDAARGRGEAVLGDTGAQQLLTVDTPVLDDIGLYPVGALIEWTEGSASRRGLVRSVSVNVQTPRTRQTLGLECHE